VTQSAIKTPVFFDYRIYVLILFQFFLIPYRLNVISLFLSSYPLSIFVHFALHNWLPPLPVGMQESLPQHSLIHLNLLTYAPLQCGRVYWLFILQFSHSI